MKGHCLNRRVNSRANVTLTLQRNTRDPNRHSYDTLFNRGTEARIPKHTTGNIQSCSSLTVSVLQRKHRQSNRKRSETGLTILFGLLIISHLPQCWSNGIRGDARTLHIFGLSARTCEYEPKIKGAGGWEREGGRDNCDMRERGRQRGGEGEFSMD